MTYWLGIDTPKVWEETERKYERNSPRLFGFPEKRRRSVQKMKKGDYILNYITELQTFFAVWEVVNGYIGNPSNIIAGKTFSECVEVRLVTGLPPAEGVKNSWHISVRQSAIQLKDEVGKEILGELKDRASAAELESDLIEIMGQKRATERMQLIAARLGQGQYRKDLLKLWDNRCAVTGVALREALRASHAKPWKMSNNQERLDPENGLPLLATLDALFDAGLITFDEFGSIILSSKLTLCEQSELSQLGISVAWRLHKELTGKQRGFLAYHREHRFQHT